MANVDPDTIKYIKTLINKLDDSIYHMYGITEKERHRIEEWFAGGEPRPGLEKYGDRHTRENAVAKPNSPHSITYDEEPEWETTCETLELRVKEQQIRLAVDGLRDCTEGLRSDEEGMWLKILPVMPGWLLREGAVGWIALTTSSAKALKGFPERYIIGFHLPKNAYKSQGEIDQDLFSIS